MAASDQFLNLTDEDGDPLYVKNDLIAIYTKAEKEKIGTMLDPALRTVKRNESRGIISKSTGQWAVRDSYEEIFTEMDRVDACESSE